MHQIFLHQYDPENQKQPLLNEYPTPTIAIPFFPSLKKTSITGAQYLLALNYNSWSMMRINDQCWWIMGNMIMNDILWWWMIMNAYEWWWIIKNDKYWWTMNNYGWWMMIKWWWIPIKADERAADHRAIVDYRRASSGTPRHCRRPTSNQP